MSKSSKSSKSSALFDSALCAYLPSHVALAIDRGDRPVLVQYLAEQTKLLADLRKGMNYWTSSYKWWRSNLRRVGQTGANKGKLLNRIKHAKHWALSEIKATHLCLLRIAKVRAALPKLNLYAAPGLRSLYCSCFIPGYGYQRYVVRYGQHDPRLIALRVQRIVSKFLHLPVVLHYADSTRQIDLWPDR